jgi:hypothetical protein
VAVRVTASIGSPYQCAAADNPARWAEHVDRPKCSLYETERGTVIGWYCKVCGWREGKSR